MKKIILSVTNDLVTDQRVHRSCMALTEAGYEVVLVGRHLKESIPISRPYKTVRMGIFFRKHAFFYAEYNLRLFNRLLWSNADLFYANDVDVLPANYWAAKIRRKPLFFDAHELFSEMPELVSRPRIRSFWRWIEKSIIPHVEHCCTVCDSFARIYKERHGVEMKVVRNVPLRSELKASGSRHEGRYRLLYQGSVNVGRGLEQMLEAMPYLDNCEFLVAGTGDCFDSLRDRVKEMGLEDRVRFLGRLPLEELRQLTVTADLGIALLKNLGMNYYYTLPNRIADYAQCAVPVLATAFPEVEGVVKEYGIGTLVESGVEDDPKRLAEAITAALREWDSIDPEERKRRFERAGSELCWERDRKVLLDAVDKALNQTLD